jgi:hypothetical protein
MSDIFISYNHEDQIRAQELAQALGGRGWSIFWDRTIPYGKTWRETIGKELSEARCVIVLWSKTSIESGWVQEEADDAKRRGVLIPIRIDDIKPPIGFRGIQTADLVNWKATRPTPAFERLKTDIAASIGARPAVSFSTDEARRTDQFSAPVFTKQGPPNQPLSASPTKIKTQASMPAYSSPSSRASLQLNASSDWRTYFLIIFSSLAPTIFWIVFLTIMNADQPNSVVFYTTGILAHGTYGVACVFVFLRYKSITNIVALWSLFFLLTILLSYMVLNYPTWNFTFTVILVIGSASTGISAVLCVLTLRGKHQP